MVAEDDAEGEADTSEEEEWLLDYVLSTEPRTGIYAPPTEMFSKAWSKKNKLIGYVPDEDILQ